MNQNTPLTAGRFFGNVGKALLYLFLFLGCQIIVSVVYSMAAAVYSIVYPELNIDTMELLLACTDQISLISGGAALILLVIFFLLCRKNPFHEVGMVAAPGRCIGAACVIAPILYAVVIVVLSMLPAAWLEDYTEASASLGDTGIIMAIATVVIAPIVEEVIFRGLILSRMNRVMPGWLAVVLSAVLFGVCHGQAVWMGYAFVLGLFFGLMTLRTGSIWPSVLAHFVFNGIGQLSSVLVKTDAGSMLFLSVVLLVGIVGSIIFHRGLGDLFFRRAEA